MSQRLFPGITFMGATVLLLVVLTGCVGGTPVVARSVQPSTVVVLTLTPTVQPSRVLVPTSTLVVAPPPADTEDTEDAGGVEGFEWLTAEQTYHKCLNSYRDGLADEYKAGILENYVLFGDPLIRYRQLSFPDGSYMVTMFIPNIPEKWGGA